MKLSNIFFYLFIFWYICGVILLGFDWLPPSLEWANTVFLMLAGLLAVFYFLDRFGQWLGILISVVIFIFSFFCEYLGSTYGILFGEYDYTDRFAPNVFNVPLAIGFAWLMVMATSHALVARMTIKGAPIIGACIAVILDLVLDPYAYKVKQYWIWEEPGLYYDIPFSNFFGWFVVALILHLFIMFVGKNQRTGLWENRMILLFILMNSMFVLLGFLERLWLAGSLTAVLSLLTLACAFRKRESVHKIKGIQQ